jgi:fido (protein-threonine AMPylation protein)
MEKFELKTRRQFVEIIEKRDRWIRLRNQLAARDRWERLIGPYWARQNCGLDEIFEPTFRQSEGSDRSRSVQLQSHIAAAQILMRFTEERVCLLPEDLLEIHRVMLADSHPYAGCFRQREMVPLGEGHEPVHFELVQPVVANALEWFRSESFVEMHEVEKTALMLIKLIDVQPFEVGNGKTLRLFSNFFLLKGGYAPAIISPEKSGQYVIAIQNSLRFHTQLIIDLIAEAVDQGLAYLLDEPITPKLTVLPT